MNRRAHPSVNPQRGFGAVAAIVVLVILASLAAALTTLSTTQQATSTEDVLSGRAYAAARSGTEVGLFKALSSTTPADPWKTCSNQSLFLDLSAVTGFHVAVTCNSTAYSEGGNTTTLYLIQATACNSSTQCPDPAKSTTPGYIERVRMVTATN
jgi:MSHA biogenesis protein MshP